MASNDLLPPLNDTILIAISQIVDDAKTDNRDPSHFDIGYEIKRANLSLGDPNAQDRRPVGKTKRIRATLSWAMENDPHNGAVFVKNFLSLIRGHGGFRKTSSNYVGEEAVQNLISAFKAEGFSLSTDGELSPILLDNLNGIELTAALEAYVRRAKNGYEDAALETGTGKDLLEATAAHVLVEKYGAYPSKTTFKALLGQAFVALGFATPEDSRQTDEPAQRNVERALFEVACSINVLRNKEGTGHGRPWQPNVTIEQARLAVQEMGIIAEYMLVVLRNNK